jgi:hypothetical protein
MKKIYFYIISIFFLGCSNLSPNQYQVKSTKENIECYKKLIDELNLNENLRFKIIKIRNSKIRGNFDPITVNQNYRLINSEEIKSNLPIEWKNNCLKQLVENRDFRGLRYINKDSIIIEIDKFERKTLSERYSRYGTIEIHRIIATKGKMKNQSFKFGSEKRKFIENLENGWIYEITHMAKH